MNNETFDQLSAARDLLLAEGDGVLSTLSLEVPGYPFGSVTPYCLDRQMRPNLLISGLAQHTKNIREDSRVSLTIIERNQKTNKQAKGRLTFLADAEKVEDDQEIRARYLRYFPEAENYFGTHDFSFYRLNPVRLRFIGGFGKIFWLEKEQFCLENLIDGESETGIVSHMNQDHAYNLVDYARFFFDKKVSESEVRMLGIDQYGIDLSIEGTKSRLKFENPMSEISEARSKLVELAKVSKS